MTNLMGGDLSLYS